jgi:hypothetical protein
VYDSKNTLLPKYHKRHASGPPPFRAQRRRDVHVHVVRRNVNLDLVSRNGQRGTLVDLDIPRRALPRALGYWSGFRRGGIEIKLDVPDRVLRTRSSTASAARLRGRRCRSGEERIACRARTEGPLERVFEPGDFLGAEAGEAVQLRRIGLCDLREALWHVREGEKGGGGGGGGNARRMRHGEFRRLSCLRAGCW